MNEKPWIKFQNRGPQRGNVTNDYEVLTSDGRQLGWIRWFASWRQYAFYPGVETLYEESCLRNIAAFCERATAERKAEVKRARA